MNSRQWTWSLLAAVGAAALLAWAMASTTPAGADEGRREGSGAGTVDRQGAAPPSSSRPSSSAEESGVQRSLPETTPCKLRLRLLSADGSPCPSEISYFAADGPLQWLPAMDRISLALVRAKGDDREFGSTSAPQGQSEIQLPGPKYLWLVATSGNASVSRRVPPFVGERTETIEFRGRRIHAMVWNEEMTEPAAGREVDCRVDGKKILTVRTDFDGYACLELDGVPCGDVQVTVAGSGAGDPASATVRVGPGEAGSDPTVVLVVPARQVSLHVDVEAAFSVERGFPPVLLLRRTDPGQDIVRCVSATLAPGHSEWQVALPPGLYEPVILPQGALAFEGGTPRIDVPDAEASDCRLTLRASDRHRLELSGVEVDVHGIMVRLWHEDDVADSADQRIWFGPHIWRRRREVVGAWDGSAHVVARNQAQVWISSEPVAAASQDQVVAMAPGMEVEVFAPPLAARNGESALVSQDGHECIRLFRTAMRPSPAGTEISAHALFLLPRRPVSVRRLDARGVVIAERTMEPRQRLAVRL